MKTLSHKRHHIFNNLHFMNSYIFRYNSIIFKIREDFFYKFFFRFFPYVLTIKPFKFFIVKNTRRFTNFFQRKKFFQLFLSKELSAVIISPANHGYIVNYCFRQISSFSKINNTCGSMSF